jgi:hypothetical protein
MKGGMVQDGEGPDTFSPGNCFYSREEQDRGDVGKANI